MALLKALHSACVCVCGGGGRGYLLFIIIFIIYHNSFESYVDAQKKEYYKLLDRSSHGHEGASTN